jgi:hypothetical protein
MVTPPPKGGQKISNLLQTRQIRKRGIEYNISIEKDEKHRRHCFEVEIYFVSLWRESPTGEGGQTLKY